MNPVQKIVGWGVSFQDLLKVHRRRAVESFAYISILKHVEIRAQSKTRTVIGKGRSKAEYYLHPTDCTGEFVIVYDEKGDLESFGFTDQNPALADRRAKAIKILIDQETPIEWSFLLEITEEKPKE
jgi:hypothetical protein